MGGGWGAGAAAHTFGLDLGVGERNRLLDRVRHLEAADVALRLGALQDVDVRDVGHAGPGGQRWLAVRHALQAALLSVLLPGGGAQLRARLGL